MSLPAPSQAEPAAWTVAGRGVLGPRSRCWPASRPSPRELQHQPVYGHPVQRERSVELRYVLDIAEIPTFQEIQDTGVVPDPDHPSVAGYARSKAEMLKAGLRAEVDGRRLAFETRPPR